MHCALCRLCTRRYPPLLTREGICLSRADKWKQTPRAPHASVCVSRKWNINANVWRAGPFKLFHQPLWLLVHAKHLLTGQVRIHKNSVIWPHTSADRMLTTKNVGCGSKIPWHILDPLTNHTLTHPESDSELEYTKQNRCLIKWCLSNGRRKRPYTTKC